MTVASTSLNPIAAIEGRLLQGTAQVLRARVSAQHDQLVAQAAENRAIAQEVDIYADAVEHLLKDNAKQRELAHVATMRAEVADERARLAEERADRLTADVERLQAELLSRPATIRGTE